MNFGENNSGTGALATFLLVVVGLAGLMGVFALFGLMGTVDTGHRGVVLNLQNPTGEIKEQGFYTKTPFVESVVEMNVQTQIVQVEASAASSDLQDVTTTIALNYKLDPSQVGRIYQELRKDWEARVVHPKLQEAVKATTAQYTAEQLITRRAEVKDKILLSIKEKLAPYGLMADDVNIVNFKFSDSFNDSIEKKVRAEQDALASKNTLERIKYEAQQAIEKAKGEADARIATATAEAEAIRIQAQAIQSQGGAEYVNLKAIEKWTGVLPVQMIPGSTVPFIDLTR